MDASLFGGHRIREMVGLRMTWKALHYKMGT